MEECKRGKASLRLWETLNADPACARQLDRIMGWEQAMLEPSYLGSILDYELLAELIPEDRTVYDLGCGSALQAWFFRNHQDYVGIDLYVPAENRLFMDNTKHRMCSIEEACAGHVEDPHFAICLWVPPWHGDNRKMVRDRFRHCHVMYPETRTKAGPYC